MVFSVRERHSSRVPFRMRFQITPFSRGANASSRCGYVLERPHRLMIPVVLWGACRLGGRTIWHACVQRDRIGIAITSITHSHLPVPTTIHYSKMG